eukprot:gene61768-biopygen26091
MAPIATGTATRIHTHHHSSPTAQPPPNQLVPDSPEHSVNSTSNASLPHSQQSPENRSQTIVKDVHLSPDDPNAVIDSGAMMTTSPRRLLMGTIWQDNIRPAPPGTSIRYGPPPAARSARLYELPRSTITRVSRLHHRTGHLPADLMCIAVSTTWRNTASSFGAADHRRNHHHLNPHPTHQTQCPGHPPRRRTPKLDTSPQLTSSAPTTQADDFKDDSSWNIGYDNVGPINPPSIEGTPSSTISVLRFFTSRGFKPRILHSDYFSMFRSRKCLTFYEDHQCRHETSAPYQQWQNAVERDIQTILGNVSATIHGQDFLRADIWGHALSHWNRLHNAVPHSILQDTPARLIDNNFHIDAHHQYRFAFGDILCFPLQDHERLWKFDVKNDIGFYSGEEDSTKGGSIVYMPYTHSFLVRGNGHRVLISDLQLLQWYSRRRDIRRNPLPYATVKDAIMDLLANRETPVQLDSNTQLLITPALDDTGALILPITLAVIQHTTTIAAPNPLTHPPRNALLPIPPPQALRRNPTNRTKTSIYKPHDIRAVTAALRTIMDRENPPPSIFNTDNDSSPRTRTSCEIETTDALKAPDSAQFTIAIQKEIHSLIHETKIFIPVTKTPTGYRENHTNRRVWRIRTTLKCKRKKKPNGEPDKHKARAAACGDTLRRAMIKAAVPLPPSYSPTIMPFTFAHFLQLAIIQQLHMATMDIKSAYLNAPLPNDADWIVTTLEPHIAKVCGLDPAQEDRIANALYGLPDSGRIFYLHYKKALLAEGYTMSAFDNCLFYRVSPTETTCIIVYVDDTFIFSNFLANIDAVITNIGKHYEVTLDRDATSFLGLNILHKPDGTVLITQPKLLTKLFALYPPLRDTQHKPIHPYPPLPKDSDPPPQPTDHYGYLRLFGILLYLTKSRPDIMAAVSFAGTKSSNPTDRDHNDLYYVVEYLRATQDIGHILHRSSTATLHLYCEVHASYLLHSDSKGHTGYTISFHGTTARAIFTLAKEINSIIALCQELHIPLELPAIIMEDNSAVVTMANNDSGYAKKCKHFLMVINYVKEQVSLGQIEARKIFGKLNNADLHTKPLRSSSFPHMAHRILGQPAPLPISTPLVDESPDPPTEIVPLVGMDVTGQPSSETKRVHP